MIPFDPHMRNTIEKDSTPDKITTEFLADLRALERKAEKLRKEYSPADANELLKKPILELKLKYRAHLEEEIGKHRAIIDKAKKKHDTQQTRDAAGQLLKRERWRDEFEFMTQAELINEIASYHGPDGKTFPKDVEINPDRIRLLLKECEKKGIALESGNPSQPGPKEFFQNNRYNEPWLYSSEETRGAKEQLDVLNSVPFGRVPVRFEGDNPEGKHVSTYMQFEIESLFDSHYETPIEEIEI